MKPTSPCKICDHPNSIDQNYCSQCGTSLHGTHQKKASTKTIFVALLILFCVPLYWVLMEALAGLYSYEIYNRLYYLNKLASLASMSVPFLLYASIQDHKFKTAGLIFAILTTLISVYWLINDLIRHFSADEVYFSF
jgi:predicted nucleic acid-binding Zn ribbon protein